MKTRIGICLLALVLVSIQQVSAQTDGEALRYSLLNYGSTARSMGMSNSFSALGADFSALSMNPAGMSLYRHHELSITPIFSNRNLQNTYLGKSESDNFFKFAFGNLGVVLTSAGEAQEDDWRNWAFGVGYNRTGEFSSNSIVEGDNLTSSKIDESFEELGGTAPEYIESDFPYSANMPWQSFLIDTLTYQGDLYYTTAIPYGGVRQTQIKQTHGGGGEWDFSLSTSYQERLFLGITMGITHLRYEEESTWEEKDIADTIPYFSSFSWDENLTTSGNGFNVKLGAIYKISDAVRVGFAFHTPSYYTLTDKYNASIKSDLQQNGTHQYDAPEFAPYEYYFHTPIHLLGSVGIVAGKFAAINAEYEFVNYAGMRYRSRDGQSTGYFNDINKAIREKYGISHAVRLGVEFRQNIFRYRVGAQISTTPFDTKFAPAKDMDQSTMGVSAGLGMRMEKYYVDLGYQYIKNGSYEQPYVLSYQTVPGIKTARVDQRFMFTVGFIF